MTSAGATEPTDGAQLDHPQLKRGGKARGLSAKERAFVEAYLQTWNATEAAKRAGYSPKTAYSQGWDLLRKPEVDAAIRRRVAETTVSTNEGLTLLTAHARGSLHQFLKVAERWTEAPRTLDEILEERADTDEDGNPVRLYRVRCVAVDVAKLLDPQQAGLIKELTDSPKEGVKLKLHDAQTAVVKLLEAQGVFRPATAASLNVPLNELTTEQLERVANGEDLLKVVAGAGRVARAAR